MHSRTVDVYFLWGTSGDHTDRGRVARLSESLPRWLVDSCQQSRGGSMHRAISNEPTNWNHINGLLTMADPSAPGKQVSVHDRDVPPWQRSGTAWNKDQRGMLALSIIQGYPIGQIIMWEKPDGKIVPIDGRQRLTAILDFARGEVQIPNDPWVPEDYRGKRMNTNESDAKKLPKLLSKEDSIAFSMYKLDIKVFEKETPETLLMDMFVRLQGGTPLNKAEVRAALGTSVANFITDVTAATAPPTEDEESEDLVVGAHKFFTDLTTHYASRRKSHRQVCDQLLNESLNGDSSEDFNLDHHWETLTNLYRTHQLKESEKAAFKKQLTAFDKAFTVDGRLSTALNKPNVISTWFRVWSYFHENFATDPRIPFGALSEEFEKTRLESKDIEPYRTFKSAIDSSGYTSGKNKERARIIREWILEKYPTLKLKDKQRLFTADQKYVIWHRAEGQCQMETNNKRCSIKIGNPRNAEGHADHVVPHRKGGATSIENGKLLCPTHNLSKG